MQVGSGENAFEGNFHRLFDSDAETFEAIFDEMFIGVLAVRPVGDHAATLGTEAVDKFVAQADSGGIGVDGDDDFFQVLERSSHERLEFAPAGTEITPLNPAAMEEAASNSPSWMMQEVCPIRESML